MIVFGQAGSEAAGRTRAQQIKAALADILVNREVEVEAGADGGYHIVAGPYKAKSRRSGALLGHETARRVLPGYALRPGDKIAIGRNGRNGPRARERRMQCA